MSDIQHSLIASFSRGTTRITRSDLVCTIVLLPIESCGLSDFFLPNSQVLAAYLNGLLVSAPTGQISIMFPDISESTV